MVTPLSQAKKHNPLKILLIEDSPTDALLLSAMLQTVTEFAFVMEHVTTLQAGLARAGEDDFDAVILDLSLPDSFGLDTYERVRDTVKLSVPIIIVTGSDDRALVTEAMKQGADNYLVKDTFDGNRIAVAILSSMKNRSQNLNTAQRKILEQ